MHHLSIDIETFSSVNIAKSGLYKYADSPDFRILLFAYSLDGTPVKVADLAAGERIPIEILTKHLFGADTVKHAYNAAFEWYCLSKYLSVPETGRFTRRDWLRQWHCTQLHGLYCGYTSGLDATGKALGLPEDKQKLAA